MDCITKLLFCNQFTVGGEVIKSEGGSSRSQLGHEAADCGVRERGQLSQSQAGAGKTVNC